MKHDNFVDPTIFEKKRIWLIWWNRVVWTVWLCGLFMGMCTLWQLYRYVSCRVSCATMHSHNALFDTTVKTKQGLQQKKKLLVAQYDSVTTWLHNSPSPYAYLAAVFGSAPHDLMIAGVTFVAGKQLRVVASSATLKAIAAYRDALAPAISYAPLHIVTVQQSAHEKNNTQFMYDCVLEAVEARNGGKPLHVLQKDLE